MKDEKICFVKRLPRFDYASMLNRSLWQPGEVITVGAMPGLIDGPNKDVWEGVMRACAEWAKYANLRFNFVDPKEAEVRVDYQEGGGSWSHLGSDCRYIHYPQPTMMFGWKDWSTYLHECGHMCGFEHSHQSVNFPYHFDQAAVIKEFSGPPNNWPASMIQSNIFDRMTESVTETPWEQREVMEYFFPARLIMERVDVSPGKEISQSEKTLIGKMYPFERMVPLGELSIGAAPEKIVVSVIHGGNYEVRTAPPLTVILGNTTLAKGRGIVTLDIGMVKGSVDGQGRYTISITQTFG